METKLFELRDRGTFIPLLCVKPDAGEDYFLHPRPFTARMAWCYGYKHSRAVIVTHMSEPSRGCHNNPHAWHDRTFHHGHLYVEDHWEELKTGDVIDVEFILGETKQPKESES